MKKKIKYIPTLQDYVKKRKKERAEFMEYKNCQECDYFRLENNVCLWGNTVKVISILKICPITNRIL